MSYDLRKTETLPEAVRRVHRERIEKTLRVIDHAIIEPTEASTAVHEVRKNLKRLRALVRLLRLAAPKVYRTANQRYRDFARSLAETRDAEVQLELLEELEKTAGDKLKKAVYEVRARLESTPPTTVGDDKSPGLSSLEALRDPLQGAVDVAETWDLRALDPDRLGAAFVKVYTRGRKAMKCCLKPEAAAADFHQWRKRVKYLRYQMQFLRPLWKRPLKALDRELHVLSDLLGAEHDRTLFLRTLSKLARPDGDSAFVEALAGIIRQQQSELRHQALDLGRRLYAEKPKQVHKRLDHLLHLWLEPVPPLATK